MDDDWSKLVQAAKNHLDEHGVKSMQHWAIIQEVAYDENGRQTGIAITNADVTAVVLRYCTVPEDWSVDGWVGIVSLLHRGVDDHSFFNINPATQQPFTVTDVFASKGLILFSVYEVFMMLCSSARFEQLAQENQLTLPSRNDGGKRRALLVTFETTVDLNSVPACNLVQLRYLTASDYRLPIG